MRANGGFRAKTQRRPMADDGRPKNNYGRRTTHDGPRSSVFGHPSSFASLRETAIRKSIVAGLCFIFLFPLPLIAQRAERRALNETSAKLTPATPESVGMSSERLAKIDEAALESVA